MEGERRIAVVLVPGADIINDSLQGTRSWQRCCVARNVAQSLVNGGSQVYIITSGAADHVGQEIPTGQLMADELTDPQDRYEVIAGTSAYDTHTNLSEFRCIMKTKGLWRKRNVQIIVVTEKHQLRRCRVTFLLKYWMRVNRQTVDYPLSRIEQWQENIYLFIGHILDPFGWVFAPMIAYHRRWKRNHYAQ